MDLNEKKELLKQAWKEVFDVDEVADDADFFDEGGDSIKAVELSSWLIQKGIKLDLGKIFYTSVLADMAESLEETQPMYVPEKLMTKELFKEKYDAVMSGKPVPEDHPEEEDQQICDPNLTGPGVEALNQQVRIPNMPPVGGLDAEDQQICDPNLTGPDAVEAPNQQIRIQKRGSQNLCQNHTDSAFPGCRHSDQRDAVFLHFKPSFPICPFLTSFPGTGTV